MGFQLATVHPVLDLEGERAPEDGSHTHTHTLICPGHGAKLHPALTMTLPMDLTAIFPPLHVLCIELCVLCSGGIADAVVPM